MKRLVLVLIAAAALVPAAARSAACSPLNCASSQFTLGGGTLLAVRGAVDKPVRVLDLKTGALRWQLPAGISAGNLLVHQSGRTVVWYDAARGARVEQAPVPAAGFRLAGVSQSGATAVLQRTSRDTRLLLLSPAHARTVALPGKNWSFDALRGDKLFLINQLRYGYQVRLFDLAANRLRGGAAQGSPRVVDDLGHRVLARRLERRPLPLHALHRRGRRRDGARARPGEGNRSVRRPRRRRRLQRGDDVRARRLAGRPHALGDQPRLRSGADDRRPGAQGGGRVPLRSGQLDRRRRRHGHARTRRQARRGDRGGARLAGRPAGALGDEAGPDDCRGLAFSPDGKTLWAVGARNGATAVDV